MHGLVSRCEHSQAAADMALLSGGVATWCLGGGGGIGDDSILGDYLRPFAGYWGAWAFVSFVSLGGWESSLGNFFST
jgi:hypothetical protein